MAGKSANEHRIRMFVAGLIVVFLLYVVGMEMWGFINAFFLAVFSYVLLKPVYNWLRAHGVGKTFSGVGAIALGAIVIGIPTLVITGLLISETLEIISDSTTTDYIGQIEINLGNLEQMFPQYNLKDIIHTEITGMIYQGVDYFKLVVIQMIGDAGNLMVQMLVAVFTLYYLLVEEDDLEKLGRNIVPFNRKNTNRLIKEFKVVTYSVLICTGLVAVIQAAPLTFAFMYYGVPAAVFWGFVAAILACIPFIGVPFVWIPIAILEVVQQDYWAALGITLVGLVVFVIENLRPIIQKKIGQIHPLISLLGVLIGIPYFGVMGVLIGPLLLSYSVLIIEMFKEEYL